MPMRKRRSSGTLSLLSPFLLIALVVAILTGFHIVATLHHDTIFDAIRRNDADRVNAFLRAGTDANGREVPPARRFEDYMNQRYTPETSWQNQRAPTPLLAALYTMEQPVPYSANVQVNRHPNLAIIRALIEHGADIRATDEMQTPPLAYAAQSGDVAVVDLLVKHGANVNEPHNGEPPLIDAASMGDTKMMRYLLDHGADVNAINSNGETALIHTVRYARQSDAVRLLLERHTYVSAKDGTGKTALWYARNPNPRLSARQIQHLPEIVALLKQAGAK